MSRGGVEVWGERVQDGQCPMLYISGVTCVFNSLVISAAANDGIISRPRPINCQLFTDFT